MFTGRDLRHAPPYLSFRLAEKKDSAAPSGRKKRAPTRSTFVQLYGSASRSSEHGTAPVQSLWRVKANRAACRSGVKSRSEVRLSVSGLRGSRPRLTALAATLASPLGSPTLRGVQRTLPLVAFLWSSRTISFRERKEMGLNLRRAVPADTKPPGEQPMNYSRSFLPRASRSRGRISRMTYWGELLMQM